MVIKAGHTYLIFGSGLGAAAGKDIQALHAEMQCAVNRYVLKTEFFV